MAAEVGRVNGVAYYTTMTVDIFFPEDKVCCRYCPLLETYSRDQCRRTGEYIFDRNTTGYDCKLKPRGEMNEQS